MSEEAFDKSISQQADNAANPLNAAFEETPTQTFLRCYEKAQQGR